MRAYSDHDRDRLESLLALAIARADAAGMGIGPMRKNPFWNQATWILDPRNVTGRASDGNDGLTDTTPLLSWNGGVLDRLGTLSPVLLQNTAFTFLSGSPPSGTDPVVFEPIVAGSAQVNIQGVLGDNQRVGSGVLAGVIAKDYASAQFLTADLGSAGPLVTENMLIVNTTPGKASRAWTYKRVAGSVFAISQPLVPATIPFTSAPPFVDTWANGDTFDIFAEDLIDLAQLVPILSGSAANMNVYQIGFNGDAAGAGFGWGYGVNLLESRCDRRAFSVQSGAGRTANAANAIFTDPFGCVGGAVKNVAALSIDNERSFRFFGGFGLFTFRGSFFTGNVILQNTPQGAPALSGCAFGTVCADGDIFVDGPSSFFLFGYDGPRLWGTGQYRITEGYTKLYASAVSIFLNTAIAHGGAPINIGDNPAGTAFTASQANPSVINGAVPITPAQIDAEAPPVGVGMFIPGLGGISTLL